MIWTAHAWIGRAHGGGGFSRAHLLCIQLHPGPPFYASNSTPVRHSMPLALPRSGILYPFNTTRMRCTTCMTYIGPNPTKQRRHVHTKFTKSKLNDMYTTHTHRSLQLHRNPPQTRSLLPNYLPPLMRAAVQNATCWIMGTLILGVGWVTKFVAGT